MGMNCAMIARSMINEVAVKVAAGSSIVGENFVTSIQLSEGDSKS